MSTEREFQVYRVNKIITDYLSGLNRNIENDPEMSALDIEALVRMEKDFYLLRKTIDKFGAKYLEYLDLISTSSPDLSRIEKYNLSLTDLQRTAALIYEDGLNTNPRSMILYANFMRVFLLKVKQAASIVKRIEIFEEKIKNYKAEDRLFYDLNLMFSERSTIIHLGANMDNLGKILHVNIGATILTKYSMHELINLNVNKIMTTTISVHHQGYLLRAFKKGVFSILYKEQRNFVVDKSGYASPISLLVKPMYNVGSNMFQYISYIQPIAKTFRYILTNPDGLIESFSENFGEMIGIVPKSLNNNGNFLYIQSLMPIFMDFFLEKRLRGGCTNETIDDFMKNGLCINHYKLNIRQEISTKLIKFTDADGVESFYPYPEEESQFYMSQSIKHQRSPSDKQGKSEGPGGFKYEKDARISEEVKQLASSTWLRFLKWHKNQGSPPGVLCQVDLVFNPIKTSSTYIFVFQIKSVQVLNRNFDALTELGQHQFNHNRTERVEQSLSKSHLGRIAARRIVVNGNLVKLPTNSVYSKDPGASMLAVQQIFGNCSPEPQKLEPENRLLKLFGEFFTQQIFFEDPNRITRKFEHDKSESLEKNESADSFLKNEMSNEMSKNLDSLKESLGFDAVSQMSSQNKPGSTFSANSSIGNSRQEEDITSIPDVEYFPQEYSLLKTSSILLVACSIIAIIVVFSMGMSFNSNLNRTILEYNLYADLDLTAMSTPTLAYIVSISSAFPSSSGSAASLIKLLDNMSSALHSYYLQLGSLANTPGIPSAGESSLSFPPVLIQTSALSVYQLCLYWLSALQSQHSPQWMLNNSLTSVFLNSERIARGVYIRSALNWTPNVANFTLSVLVVLLVGFVLSATFAFWVQLQSSKCYTYLNKVYGIVTSFPAHVIKAQKMLVIDLYELLETKIEEKKVQVKIRKSGIRSEERAKLDLGLKTSGKVIGELEVPRILIIAGILGLLLLILAFDLLVLLNMGFFSNSNDQALKLNYKLMMLQIGLSGYTYSSLTKSFQLTTGINTLSAGLQEFFPSLLDSNLMNIEDLISSLAHSDSKFQSTWDRYLADQCTYEDSITLLRTDLFNTACTDIQGGILKYGLGRSLAEVSRNLMLISQDPQEYSATLSLTSQPNEDILRTISAALRVQSFLHSLTSQYRDFLTLYFSTQATWSLITNLVLIASLAAVSSLGWYLLLKGFQKRVLESKNVIATLPPLILQQNMRARKFLQAIFEDMRKT